MLEGVDWLPPLVCMADYSDDWTRYLNHVYSYFWQDFIGFRPAYRGKRCTYQRKPETNGLEYTFWHLITEDQPEGDRVPQSNRCERIRWPKPIIEAASEGRLWCWREKRGGDPRPRLHLALSDFSYLVVLSEKAEHLLLITAYFVEQPIRRAKLKKRCDEYSLKDES